MVGIGHPELGQRGTVVDPIVGAKAAQIPSSRVDLDWIYGPTPSRAASPARIVVGRSNAI
jgi:hypothetical protein